MTEMGYVNPGAVLDGGYGRSPALAAQRILAEAGQSERTARTRTAVVTARAGGYVTATVAGASVPSIPCVGAMPIVGATVLLIEVPGGYACLGGVGTWGDTDWINMQLQNAWVNYDSGLSIGGSGRPAQYRRVNGMLIARGYIKSGVIGTVFWNVPANFRALAQGPNEVECTVASNNALALIGYNGTAQAATVDVGSNVWISLSGVTWAVEA